MAKLFWKVHTTSLLNQILDNPGTSILFRPLQAFANLLDLVATRASQLNDPELNALMCRLGLYEISNPDSKEYNPALCNEIIEAAQPALAVDLPYMCSECGSARSALDPCPKCGVP